MRYKMTCEVKNASKSDLDQWLANHASGRHASLQYPDHACVYLDVEADRIALREAFDVAKVNWH